MHKVHIHVLIVIVRLFFPALRMLDFAGQPFLFTLTTDFSLLPPFYFCLLLSGCILRFAALTSGWLSLLWLNRSFAHRLLAFILHTRFLREYFLLFISTVMIIIIWVRIWRLINQSSICFPCYYLVLGWSLICIALITIITLSRIFTLIISYILKMIKCNDPYEIIKSWIVILPASRWVS